ncbi:MAG: hypothetical protein KIS78_17525 [Labilithrix sp.]|nr:hypothetical protein [Labilithrix sp.]
MLTGVLGAVIVEWSGGASMTRGRLAPARGSRAAAAAPRSSWRGEDTDDVAPAARHESILKIASGGTATV